MFKTWSFLKIDKQLWRPHQYTPSAHSICLVGPVTRVVYYLLTLTIIAINDCYRELSIGQANTSKTTGFINSANNKLESQCGGERSHGQTVRQNRGIPRPRHLQAKGCKAEQPGTCIVCQIPAICYKSDCQEPVNTKVTNVFEIALKAPQCINKGLFSASHSKL